MNLINEYQPQAGMDKIFCRENAANILLIGCGHLGLALLQKWLKTDLRCQVISSKAAELAAQFPDAVFHSAAEDLALDSLEVVILAVPPASVLATLQKYQPLFKTPVLFVSVAAGLTLSTLAKVVPAETPISRVMPNLLAQIGAGVTGAYHNAHVTEQQRELVEKIFAELGHYFTVEHENQLDVITPLFGSGPAFLFLLCQALEASGEALGLDKNLYGQMVRLMLKGSAEYLCANSNKKAAQLREAVSSKGGVTEAAMDTLRPQFEKLIYQAVYRGQQRCRELNHENNS